MMVIGGLCCFQPKEDSWIDKNVICSLFLDRPEKLKSLVEVCVVVPASFRFESCHVIHYSIQIQDSTNTLLAIFKEEEIFK